MKSMTVLVPPAHEFLGHKVNNLLNFGLCRVNSMTCLLVSVKLNVFVNLIVCANLNVCVNLNVFV